MLKEIGILLLIARQEKQTGRSCAAYMDESLISA